MSAVCVMKDIKPDKIADQAGTGKKVRLKYSLHLCEIVINSADKRVHYVIDFRLLGAK